MLKISQLAPVSPTSNYPKNDLPPSNAKTKIPIPLPSALDAEAPVPEEGSFDPGCFEGNR